MAILLLHYIIYKTCKEYIYHEPMVNTQKKKKRIIQICIYKNKNKDIDFPMYSTKFISMPYECI